VPKTYDETVKDFQIFISKVENGISLERLFQSYEWRIKQNFFGINGNHFTDIN
jgi:hypothetical protein